MSILARLFGRRQPDPREAMRPLWQRMVATARRSEFYAEHHVADTVSGRFDMICMVTGLVMLRLEAAGLRAESAWLTELFVEDIEGQLREFGVNDVVVGKRMGTLMSALGGRLGALREALAGGDLRLLAQAIERNVTFADAGSPLGVAETMQALHRELAGLSDAALLSGSFGDKA